MNTPIVRRRVIRCLIGAALFVAGGAAMAADSLTLHEEAYVKGPKVYLGDVADIEGENAVDLAMVEVASAALPGASKRLNAALVASRIRHAGRAALAARRRCPPR